MKNILSIVMLIVAFIAVTHAQIGPPRNTHFPQPKFPNSRPSQWNRPSFSRRFRRSADDKNRITVEGQKQGGGSSYNIDYGRTIYENKHGSVVVNGGMNKEPHGRPQKHIGIQGQWRF
ncbi:uncharacterized protein LOC127286331 [Leptopilina boulardi]|uniref:uncharacterized protein LOC127286331 n=1 Tax=Leptopilina boulardi TaxID=63433 RepID=UPI0021F52D84|nr:uncharacterized protein LOC127286331 [Leptopilina boulardi]